MKKKISIILLALLVSGCTNNVSSDQKRSEEENTISKDVEHLIVRTIPRGTNQFEYKKIDISSGNSENILPADHQIILDEERVYPNRELFLVKNKSELYVKNVKTDEEIKINLPTSIEEQDVVMQRIHLAQQGSMYFSISRQNNDLNELELRSEFIFDVSSNELKEVDIQKSNKNIGRVDAVDLASEVALIRKNIGEKQEVILFDLKASKELQNISTGAEIKSTNNITNHYFQPSLEHLLIPGDMNEVYLYQKNTENNLYSFTNKVQLEDNKCEDIENCTPKIIWGSSNNALVDSKKSHILSLNNGEEKMIENIDRESMFTSDLFGLVDIFLINDWSIFFSSNTGEVVSLDSNSERKVIFNEELDSVHLITIF